MESRPLSSSTSAQFCPDAGLLGSQPPDVVLMSSDGIRFYVQRSVLSQNSANSFGGLFGSPHSVAGEVPTFEVQEVHATMNVILLALYDLPITAGLAVLDTALSALTKVYEVPSKTLLYSPTTSLAAAILIHVEDHPLAVYVLAAKHDAYLLAAAASEHLYSLAFSSLSEEDAVQMGPLYLKRLYMLLHGRREALKTLVARPPDQHAPTPGAPTCNSSLRARIAQDWTLAAAEIVWKGGPAVQRQEIAAVLARVVENCLCSECEDAVHRRIETITREWEQVQRTI